MEADASGEAIGATLYQEHGVLGFFSKKLSTPQRNYTNTERELLAIIEGLSHFRTCIYGVDLIIKTDHANLLHSPDLQKSRAQRWKLLLEEFPHTLIYVPGKDNQMADALSRCFRITGKEEEDSLKKCIIEALTPKSETTGNDNSEEKRLCINPEKASYVLTKIHDYLGHPGAKTLITTVSYYLKIRNLKKLAYTIARDCVLCQESKTANTNYGALTGTLNASKPLSHLSSDILGPIPREEFRGVARHSKFWVLTITDRCTRWSKLYVVYDITPATVLKCLQSWIDAYGQPESVLSDQGRQYTAKIVKSYLKERGIQQVLCTPYSPTSNGISERINQSILFTLRHFKHLCITQAIRLAERRLQLCYHRTLGVCPVELVSNRHPLDVLETRNMRTVAESTKRANSEAERRLIQANENRILSWRPTIGAKVFRKNHGPGKLAARWKGPYVIDTVHENRMTVDIRDKNNKIFRANIRQIRPY